MGWRRILADALAAAGQVAYERGDQGAALNAADEARRLYAGLGDRAGVAGSLLARGEALYRLGDLERAERVLTEAVELFEAEGDRAGLAQALLRQGAVAMWRGEPEVARARFTRQRTVLEGLGDRFQLARCVAALGELARQQGELDEAERAYRRALEIDEGIGSKSAWMDRLNLGLVLLARGDFEAAQRLSARVVRDLGPSPEPSQRCLVLVQRLPPLAHAGDWAAWAVTLTEARHLLGETGLADGDVAWLLELAGDEAQARGAVEPAQAALELAAAQWRALGRPERAEAVRRRIPAA
jgi:tetratricopeptide (TPR) repeat protein